MTPMVTVAQLGARRHYAVAEAFHRRGRLSLLLTDLYFPRRSLWRTMAGLAGSRASVNGRSSDVLPGEMVVAANARALLFRALARCKRSREDDVKRWLRTGRWFCRWAAPRIPEGSGALYGFTSAALELFREAKRRGLTTLLDHATAPIGRESELVDDAWNRWPAWFARPPRSPHEAAYAERQREEWTLADRIVCGSEFLRRLVVEAGGPGDRCVLVPLGGDFSIGRPGEPRRASRGGLTVAFAGDDGLRKGLPDALEACRAAGIPADRVLVAGSLTLTEEGRRLASGRATLMGRLGREGMRDLLDRSDVLLLPTVSDTFGLVVLEAMGRGCIPVVSERAGAADVVEEGRSGFVVPVHGIGEIAERLNRLDSDGALRASMSAAAVARSREYSVERYGDRLMSAVAGVATGAAG